MRKLFAFIAVLIVFTQWSYAATSPGASPSPSPTASPKPRQRVKASPSPGFAVSPAVTPVLKTRPREHAAASPVATVSPAASPVVRVRRRQASAAPSVSPTATPKPRKASLFHRIFVGGTPTPTPVEKAIPIPVSKPVRGKKWPTPSLEVPEEQPTPIKTKKPALPALKGTYKPTPAPIPQEDEVPPKKVPESGKVTIPAPAETPAASEGGDKPAGMTSDVPFVPSATPEAEKPKPVVSEEEQDKDVKARYREIKAVALEDKEVKALKDKSDAASDADQVAAEKAYYKALFKKMRTLDPTLTDHVDRMEKAMMKKLDGGAGE